MSNSTHPVVVDVATVQTWLQQGRALRLIDARCAPAIGGGDREAGRKAWQAGHLPGAVHADLDGDLAAPAASAPGQGRHPLPAQADFTAALGRWGIGTDTPVVVYDAADGSMAAARLWWLLRLLGHAQVSVLDGGVAAWTAAGLALETATPQVPALPPYPGQYDMAHVVSADQVLARLGQEPGWLLDARGPARFAGEQEPVDAVAGHVPGAINLPYAALVGQGRLLAPEQIRQRVSHLLGNTDLRGKVLMCGSGVTACHLLLALEHAGLTGAQVFAGSWSGWISDSLRPVSVGLGN
jgi:thiosulfate/3-mercaptopyruvate sulfurtransferase